MYVCMYVCICMLARMCVGAVVCIQAGVAQAKIFEEMVSQQREVSYRDIIPLVGKKTLCLHRGWYAVERGVSEVEAPAKDDSVVDLAFNVTTESRKFSFVDLGDKLVVRVLVGEFDRLQRPAAEEMILKCVLAKYGDKMKLDTVVSQIRACMDALERLTMGGVKSVLQKVLRFGAKQVSLPTSSSRHGHVVCSNIMAACCSATLFVLAGAFIPELQCFSRGCVAALKRLAVIIMEDAWLSKARLDVLTVAALLFQRCPSRNPWPELISYTIEVTLEVVDSPCIWDWRGIAKQPNAKQQLIAKYEPLSTEIVTQLQITAKTLRIVKSFQGDLTMADLIAKTAKRRGEACLLRSRHSRPDTMPLCHAVDQHAFRGIGHTVRLGVKGFSQVFHSIFTNVTGYNYRFSLRLDPKAFDEADVVLRVRFGQRIVLQRAMQRPRDSLACTRSDTIHCQIDSGVLSSAIGPIEVFLAGKDNGVSKKRKRGEAGSCTSTNRRARKLLVTLGTLDAAEEVVMRKPTRSSEDLYGDISDEEKERAVTEVRSREHTLKSPYPIGRKATFSRNGWMVDGQLWTEICEKGLEVTHSVHPPISLDFRGLADDPYLRRCLDVEGDGLVENAQEAVRHACSNVPQAVRVRAVSLLQQQYSSVVMPVPSLDGGIGHDSLMAFDTDPSVWRFLVVISRAAPGALCASVVPKFSVKSPMLLRLVLSWIASFSNTHDSRGAQQMGNRGESYRVYFNFY